MAQVGAKLIWSPQSNLTLYGQTTRIPLALEHGVPVSLGVDWNPTGSDDIFEELRAASKVNEEKFAGAIPKTSWIPMITENPAEALALSDKIGTLAPGLKADITVLASEDADPTETLLKTRLEDVEMVWVGGRATLWRRGGGRGRQAQSVRTSPGPRLDEADLREGRQQPGTQERPDQTADSGDS